MATAPCTLAGSFVKLNDQCDYNLKVWINRLLCNCVCGVWVWGWKCVKESRKREIQRIVLNWVPWRQRLRQWGWRRFTEGGSVLRRNLLGSGGNWRSRRGSQASLYFQVRSQTQPDSATSPGKAFFLMQPSKELGFVHSWSVEELT